MHRARYRLGVAKKALVRLSVGYLSIEQIITNPMQVCAGAFLLPGRINIVP